MGACSGTSPSLSVNPSMKNTMLLKKGSNPTRKNYNNGACKVWEEIVELCDKTQMKFLTLRSKVTSPQDDD